MRRVGGGEDWKYAGYEGEVTQDLRAVVQHVREHGCRVVALIGHSRGASDVLLYAARFGDVPFIVPIAPRFNLAGGVDPTLKNDVEKNGEGTIKDTKRNKVYVVSRKDLEERLSYDMGEMCRKIVESKQDVDICIMHGDRDVVVPVEDSSKYKEILGEDLCTLTVIEGGSHNFLDNPLHRGMVAGAVTGIIREKLRSLRRGSKPPEERC
eukprot:GHVU01129994.1.p2 GENE.GHVU01129994.1~~GHVU01129994.1.p2  ORF type:complete len:209 (-),score=34.19 GHVU01129994.1:629-1255(-)